MSVSLQANLPPLTDPIVAEVIAQMQQQLDAQSEQLNAASQQLDAQQKQRQADVRELAYAQLKIQILEERLRKMRIAKYGNASEKLSDLQLDLLELEPGVSSEEVQAESERESLAESSNNTANNTEQHKTKRKHPGRQTLPAHLERVEKIVACSPEECLCGGCGQQTIVIGYEESEVLDVKPSEYFVRVTKREKRACKQCEEQGVAVAPVPESIIAKSLVSDQVVIDTLVHKYADYVGFPVMWRSAPV